MAVNRRILELVQQTGKPRVRPGVIEGVRVLGRYSPNSHGEAQATKGTEYPPEMMRRSASMYDGARVCIGHVQEASKRDPNAMVGVLKNCRFDGSKPGDECLRADLHYLESHEMGRKLAEDANRKLGVFGLSQDAYVEDEELVDGRLVVKSLAKIETVDVVYKAATNRNLLESDRTGNPMKTKNITLRKLIESAIPTFKTFKKHRALHAYRLLEDSTLDKDMDKAMEVDDPTEGGGEPDGDEDPLDAGFMAAMMAVLKDDTIGSDDKIAKLKKLLAAQESLCEEEDPGDPTKEADEDDDKKDDEKKQEADDDEKKDDKDKPKKEYKKESAVRDPELERLRREKEVRKVCESAGYTPNEQEVEDFAGMSDAAVKRIVGKLKADGGERRSQESTQSTPAGKTAKSVSPFEIIVPGVSSATAVTETAVGGWVANLRTMD